MNPIIEEAIVVLVGAISFVCGMAAACFAWLKKGELK